MTIMGVTYTTQELQQSQLIKDMRDMKTHLCKTIMAKVQQYIDANPRKVTLRLYLHYNYPKYDNDTDCQLIWDLAHTSPEYISNIVFNI